QSLAVAAAAAGSKKLLFLQQQKLTPVFNSICRHWLSDTNAAQSSQPPIRLTDECSRRLSELHRTQGSHLRVLVEGGGCSGFQYKFLLDDSSSGAAADDCTIECPDGGGAKVFIDADSLELLRGCTLDYQRELIREGFKVVSNPQAEKGCSCGSSFAARLD
ncbi:hypothetical protein BOX15_Mlig000976g1, partial [Macrostomum lignano]